MRHLKLFESFSNVNKIEAVNNILFVFIIVKRLETLNLKSITIEIDKEEHLIFYYSKNNACQQRTISQTFFDEEFHGFIHEKDGYRIGYFSVGFFYNMFSSSPDPVIKILVLRLSLKYSEAKAIKTYFNLDKVELTNSGFIKKKYDAVIDKYETTPPITKG